MILSRYFSRQIWTSFIGFGLVLGGLAWMVQILLLLRLIVRYGVDIRGFLGLSLYTIPLLAVIIMPFVIFIAVMFVYGKMIENNEITVMSASGMSPLGIARPALKVGLAIMMIHYAMSLHITPRSQDLFYSTQWELRFGLGHLKLREATFNTLMNNVVIYVEQVSKRDLLGLTMRDGRNPGEERIITAEHGKLVNTPNGLSIVMGIGGMQMTGKNSVVFGTFSGAQMDLEMRDSSDPRSLRARRLSTMELVQILRTLENYDSRQRSKLVIEGANRFLAPVMGFLLILIAMVCLLKTSTLRRSASFSGLAAVVAMISVQALFMLLSAASVNAAILFYMGAGQLALIAGLLWYLRK